MLNKLIFISVAIFMMASCDDDTASGNNANNQTNNVNNTNNSNNSNSLTFPVVETAQTGCYGEVSAMGCADLPDPFGGQDYQFDGIAPSYTDNGDGTVTDNVTGLMWVQTPDMDGDGVIDASDKLTWPEIQTYVNTLNASNFAGYSDWRLPHIKELYSLINFNGTDPSSGVETNLVPFINDDVFGFAWGDTASGERTIDSQYASSTVYVSTEAGELLFGVNFADGRIKGYGVQMGSSFKTFLLLCVRGNDAYGINSFTDNGDGTVSDAATGLMWSRDDSGEGMNWEEALAYAQEKNAENWLGYNDWRVPSVKELHSIVDYSRSPDTTSSAAISSVFNVTTITNERNETDYPWYWSSTTHKSSNGTGSAASYVAFGRALGYMNSQWIDVHGAGAQRSDPKNGDPADYPTGFGPQGDAIRIFNYVRLVRGGASWNASVSAGVNCGNETCDADESVETCPEDCKAAAVCGNGMCEEGETPESCSTDCTNAQCGNGSCDTGETMESCPEDCSEGPVSCEVEADCDAPDACPDEAALGCTCSETPDGQSACIPQCNTADDCPPGPGGITLECNPQGICVPSGM